LKEEAAEEESKLVKKLVPIDDAKSEDSSFELQRQKLDLIKEQKQIADRLKHLDSLEKLQS